MQDIFGEEIMEFFCPQEGKKATRETGEELNRCSSRQEILFSYFIIQNQLTFS